MTDKCRAHNHRHRLLLEIDISAEPRDWTDRTLVIAITYKTSTTIKEVIKKHVRYGSIIWTNTLTSYVFLIARTKRNLYSNLNVHLEVRESL